MSWEACKTHLQATGLLYSPGNVKLSDDPCPMPGSTALKSLLTDYSDILTGGSIKIPITPLAEIRFYCGYFDRVQHFLSDFFKHLFRNESIQMKSRIIQKWSVKKYKELFSIEERSKLEDVKPNTWDIVLLYKVIQVECWRVNSHEWMIMDQLINFLKKQLHQLAHNKLTIDKAEIVVRLTYLSKVLYKMCKEGSKMHHRIQHRDMKNLAEWIDPTITDLTLLLDKKPLSQQDFNQYPELEKKIAKYKRNLENGLKYKMKLELFMCHLLYFSPTKLFSKFTVHINISSSDCITQEIDYNNIFTIKLKDGSTPDMYIISGPRAVGKSIYLKYISQQSYEDPMSIPGVDQFEVIFTAQFQNDDMDNLQELIKQKLPNTLEEMGLDSSEIEIIILQSNILIMIDGYDEVTVATQNLLKELMSYESNIKIICTTRTEDLEELLAIIPTSRKYVHIIPKANTLKENCTKDEHSFEKNFDFLDDTDTNTWDINMVRETMVWDKGNNESSLANKELDFNELSAQVLKLCSFVERLLGASMIIRNCKGQIDENTLIIFQDLLKELKDFRNQVEEFILYSSKELREVISKREHRIFEDLLHMYKEICGKEIHITQSKFKELEVAEMFIQTLLKSPENILKKFVNERYFEMRREFKEKEPSRLMIFASMEELANLGSKVSDFSFLVDHNNAHIDNETKKSLWKLVEEIQNLRNQCENYNYSLPKNITKILPFTGLEYWFHKITSPYLRQDLVKHCNEMVCVLDTGDKKLKQYLLTPAKVIQGPKLTEPWKDEADIEEDIDMKINWKPSFKGKKSKSKKKKR